MEKQELEEAKARLKCLCDGFGDCEGEVSIGTQDLAACMELDPKFQFTPAGYKGGVAKCADLRKLMAKELETKADKSKAKASAKA